VLIHLGPHKTGTTTLQSAFNALRETFEGQGVYYPMGLHGSGAHHVLAWQLLQRPLGFLGFNDADVDEPGIRLVKWVDEALMRGCGTMLLSAEDFSLLEVHQWDTVREALQRVPEVRSIGSVWVSRSAVSMARSAYGTLVMFGENRPFEEVESILVNRFQRVLSKLDYLTGRDGVFDRRIELKFDSLARSGNFVEAFCGQVLGKSTPNIEWPALNVSQSPAVLEAVRVWNTVHCCGVTVEEKTGDFPSEVFTLDPEINQRRIEYTEHLLRQMNVSL
jgi:hypothetical protein